MNKRFLILCASVLLAIGVHAQFITVSDLLQLRKVLRSGRHEQINAVVDAAIINKGYENKYSPSDNELYFYKNCRLVIADSPGRLARGIEVDAEPKNSLASMCYISVGQYGGYISVTVYSKANAQKWIDQLKALGYRNNGNGGEGNQGRDWEYSKMGYPDITVWNDYGVTYSLSVSF